MLFRGSIVAVSCVIALIGCGETTVDGETGETGAANDDGSDGDTGGDDDGYGSAPYANCDGEGSCARDNTSCITDPFAEEDPGLQWCGEPCQTNPTSFPEAGDPPPPECPPGHPNSQARPFCFDPGEGDPACALDCGGGFNCPPGMECFNGWLCVWS